MSDFIISMNVFWYRIRNTLKRMKLFNFILGARGYGKTYSSAEYVVEEYLKSGKCFIYIRRYKTEVTDLSEFFLKCADKFPNNKLEVKGRTFYVDGKKMGWALVLSKSMTYKSRNFPSHNLSLIIFDEFIIESKSVYRYLGNEVETFLSLYETICRGYDVQVAFLANAVTEVCPYFTYFGIRPPSKDRYFTKGDVLIEKADSKEFAENKKKTRFGQLIKDTDYGRYMIDNEFTQDNKDMIKLKSANSQYLCSISYEGEKVGFWGDYQTGEMYASNQAFNNGIEYASTNSDLKPNVFFAKRTSRSSVLLTIKDSYKEGVLYYENMKVQDTTLKILKIMGV